MATASRPSRFQSYSMHNGSREDKPSQSSSFATTSTSSWSGIWSHNPPNPIGSSFSSKQDTTGSRGSDDHYPSALTGSGALAATSEADSGAWPSRGGPWNVPENPQTRPTSGDTSPNCARDPAGQSLTDLSTPYFSTSRPVAQQHSFPSQSKTNGGLGGATSGASLRFGSSAFSEVAEDKENSGSFGSVGGSKFDSYSVDNRASRDHGYLNAVGAPYRDGSMLPARQADLDVNQGSKFGDSALNGLGPFPNHKPNPIISQRPTMPSHSASFPSPMNSRAYNLNSHIDEENLNPKFSRAATLQESLDQTSNTLSFANSSAIPFQFNPGSQPWSGDAKPYGNAQFRSTISPKAYTDTPPLAVDAWSRPPSRDPRMVQELERSRTGQTSSYLAPQASFYTTFYPQGISQYPAHPFDPYPHAHPTYRPQIHMPYGIPVAPYLSCAPAAAQVLRTAKEQDNCKGVRSMLLEEFRGGCKSNKKYELRDIYNHVVEFSGDQHGSRFIQSKLEAANSDEKDQAFREIEPNAIQLMRDVFGNYVIQKFFEHGNQVQKKILAGVMKGKMVDLSCQMYSCRVVQKALEHILVEQQAELVAELQPDVVRIIKDQNGNHVIQKVIEVVPRAYTNFVMDALRGSISQMASHAYGCRVIQRLMEHGSEADKTTIMDEINACAQFLVTDQYGNYVTQHVLKHGKQEDCHKMIGVVFPQLLTLSKHKFASNVVEKCIDFSSEEDRRSILDQMYKKGPDGASSLQLLVKDQYGNYVIQKFLSHLEGAERALFVEELKPCVLAMKKVSTGRTVHALDKLIQLAAKPASKKAATPSEAIALSPLHVDSQSADQTPALTREPNTPQSSDRPSTNDSAVGEAALQSLQSQVNGAKPGRHVQVTHG